MEYITLRDGNTIPAVGFGVFLIPNDGSTYDAVTKALHLATATSTQRRPISMKTKLAGPSVTAASPVTK